MLIEAKKEACVNEIAVIAAALSIQDPRERPYDKTDQASKAHVLFAHPESDFLTYLNIWNRLSWIAGKSAFAGQTEKILPRTFSFLQKND